MQIGSSSQQSISMAVAKKALASTREQGQQALSLIQSSTNAQANAPQKTSGLHLVA